MLVYKQTPSTKFLHLKLCRYVHLGVKLHPITFGTNIIYSNEWVGLNVKILKW